MPETSKINIVRPDGSVFRGTEKELANLQFLDKGYHAEETEEAVERLDEEATKEYYQSGTQVLGTVIEGTASGLSLGLSDPLVGEFKPDADERARYNPGTRLASEIVGAVGGSITGVGPAGLLTKGATAAGKAVGGGFRGAVTSGALEGVGAGFQAAVSESTLSGDPLTAESIRTGIGYGALFGGALGGTFNLAGRGLSALGNKLEVPEEKVFEKSNLLADYEVGSSVLDKARPADKVFRREVKDLIKPIDDASFSGLKNTINEFSTSGYRMGDDLEGALQNAADNYTASFAQNDLKPFYGKLSTDAENLAGEAFFKGVAGKEVGIMKSVGRKALEAVDAGDFTKASEMLQRYNASIKRVASITGTEVAELQLPKIADRTALQAAIASAGSAVETRAAAAVLSSFPASGDAFVRMSPKRAEQMFAALDNVFKNQGDEIQPFRQALIDNVQKAVDNSGIIAQGNPLQQLKEVYRFGRLTPTDEIITTIEESVRADRSRKVMLDASLEVSGKAKRKAHSPIDSFGEHLMAKFTGGAAGFAAGGPVGGAVGYYGTRAFLNGGIEGLHGLKTAVQNRVAKAAKKTGKALGSREANYVAAKAYPMYYRIDGSYDEKAKKKDLKSLAKDRITEVTELAPAAKNIIYSSIEPLVGMHPELAAAVLNSAVAGFNMFLDMIPKDPGVAVSGGKSLWKPNDVQAAQFSKMHEAFMFPVGVIEDVLSGVIDVIKVNTIKAVHPELYQFMRGLVLENVDFSEMSYREQAKYNILLDTMTHSSFEPTNIAESQRIFMETPQVPESGNKGGTPGNAGGAPPKMEPPTPAQSLLGK